MEVLPATVEQTISVLLGGINIPVGADEILTAAQNFLSYPSFSSIGAIVPPTAAAAATPEPLIAPKNMLATTFA